MNIKMEVANLSLYSVVKRLSDVIGAVLGMTILSPVFLIIAIAIKLEDPRGPIIFTQVRVGKNGKYFKIYKFRSMRVNAEEELAKLKSQNDVKGAMFKLKNDPRVTRVGHFIRKRSLDELPQLYNVLIGDMSLIGPRPPLVNEVAAYSKRDLQRLRVRPGCSGLWQISGRNELDFDEMVDLDLEYIQKRSILFDLEIIWKTVVQMIFPKGAY
ncbi:Galactosyl transferase CpsE [Pediococcus acidilactici]|uniref:sugar transferase n=1 Tax=Pediococcus acidilactici TaxID=1254 RepID=UPI0007EF3C7E|nr:sugar transferase [Pediococcus acidilactici]ARW25343.1 Galactosyl transferase CpsE [Pediococcus acidilactici]ARW27427.1 Galactosyl transferase CpsE [Pediococcus acidilactici]ARW29460.1 Galactosyl transferase CpsE [Pediococcus acidilactici]OBR31261.1 Galactosyl transferase CpsE [Pediococcus acidilactici]WDA27930.1 sugar transferase [Pediococcus acidilactici]